MRITPTATPITPQRDARPAEPRVVRPQPATIRPVTPEQAPEPWQSTLSAEEIEMIYAVRAIRERHHSPDQHPPESTPTPVTAEITVTVHAQSDNTNDEPHTPRSVQHFKQVEAMSDDITQPVAPGSLNLFA